jgi:hypothetical protein
MTSMNLKAKPIHAQCKALRWSRRIILCLLTSVLLRGTEIAEAQFVTEGTVEARGNVGNTIVANMRVQMIDRRSRKVMKNTEANDNTGRYKLSNLVGGSIYLVACHDLLEYEPFHRTLKIPDSPNPIDFVLDPLPPSHANPFSVPQPVKDKPAFVYFKHKETGCELKAIPTDEKGVLKTTIRMRSDLLAASYDFCVDTIEEISISPYEACCEREQNCSTGR